MTSVASEAAPEVQASGTWRLIWRRLRRDRIALAAGVCLLLILFAVSAGGPLIGRIVGTGPNDPHPFAVDEGLKPVGPWTRVPAATSGAEGKDTVLLVLGGDGQLGRDELQRLLYGGRVSIIVAVGAALLAMTIGVLLGWLAVTFGGFVDGLISRLTDLVMSLPVPGSRARSCWSSADGNSSRRLG